MGNKDSSFRVALCDEQLVFGNKVGLSPEETHQVARLHARVFSDASGASFEGAMAQLRGRGLPPAVAHRAWLFWFHLHRRGLRRRGPASSGAGDRLDGAERVIDLDAEFGVLPILAECDPAGDAELLRSEMVRLERDEGAPRSSVATAAIAAMDPRVAFSPFEQFERPSGRVLTLEVLLCAIAWFKRLTASRRRKAVWAWFSVGGKMYPGRLLQLGAQTARAFGIEFGLEEARAVEQLQRHAPRSFLSYFEWVAWSKMMNRAEHKNGEGLLLLWNGFGLLPHYVKFVRRTFEALDLRSLKPFEGVCRVDNELRKSIVRVTDDMLTVESKGGSNRLVYPLKHSYAFPDEASRLVVVFQPAGGSTKRFLCKTQLARSQLCSAVRARAIAHNAATSNRFGSFHPEDKEVVSANFFVDGADYFAAVLEGIRSARHEILIAGWSLSPELYLRRGSSAGPDCRLDVVLKQKASEGVRVHILLWWEVELAVKGTVNSGHVRDVFAESSVMVLAHPINNVMGRWSHHQKFVVLDRCVAFLGGLDLCFGRYDTPEHELRDDNHLAVTWPGKDFYNPSIVACDKLHEPFVDNIDRSQLPRQPWHDQHVQFTGGGCNYLAGNFIDRWNKALSDMNRTGPLLSMGDNFGSKSVPFGSPIRLQLVRSIGPWSGATSVTESSILSAYLHAIETAQHFLYIENQFFVSSTDVVQNQIANTIVARVARAIEEGTAFRVVIVLPLHPEGPFNATAPRIVSLWTHRTFVAMEEALERACPGARLDRHVTVHCLLKHACFGDTPFLNMIYVHSKLLMADDRVAIVGSANINDRSMLGDRDSEIAVFLESADDCDGVLGGAAFRCSALLRRWRLRTWKELLGVADEACLLDALEGCALFDRLSGLNAALAAPVVDVEPQRIWIRSAEGLPHRVSEAQVARTVREWKMGVAAFRDDEERCHCCHTNDASASLECAMCQEAICAVCANDVAQIAPSAAVPRTATGRKTAVPTEQLEVAVASGASGNSSVCHKCANSNCPVVSLPPNSFSFSSSSSSSISATDVLMLSSTGGTADFLVKNLLRRLGLDSSDDAVASFVRLCGQNRVLARSMLSTETKVRFQALSGYVFPYPIHFCPRIKTDIIAVAPTEIFI